MGDNKELLQLKKEYDVLKTQYEELQKKYEELQNEKKYNARGAGRKPSSERKETIRKMYSMYLLGMTEDEIMCELNISRSTYFRYKKELAEQNRL